MKTATELHTPVGATGIYVGEQQLAIWVKVLNTRERFGEVDYLITPVAGAGQRWVVSYKVQDLTMEDK